MFAGRSVGADYRADSPDDQQRWPGGSPPLEPRPQLRHQLEARARLGHPVAKLRRDGRLCVVGEAAAADRAEAVVQPNSPGLTNDYGFLTFPGVLNDFISFNS